MPAARQVRQRTGAAVTSDNLSRGFVGSKDLHLAFVNHFRSQVPIVPSIFGKPHGGRAIVSNKNHVWFASRFGHMLYETFSMFVPVKKDAQDRRDRFEFFTHNR